MLCCLRQFVRGATASILVAIFAFLPAVAAAETHVVSPADLQKQVLGATQARQQNLEKVRQFLTSPKAEKALKSAKIDPQQLKTAVGSLSDEELSQLAARADKTQGDFAAGTLSDRDLLIILVAVAALILIIVAVR